jgi:RNA-directed DNA polymerase
MNPRVRWRAHLAENFSVITYGCPERRGQAGGVRKGAGDLKQRIRQLTHRSGGRSMTELVEPLRCYMLGWKAYFGLAQTPKVRRTLDEWIRHRLRAIQLRHWKRGTTTYRKCPALGAPSWLAQKVAVNNLRWWSNSGHSFNGVLTIAYFDSLGFPRLS